MRAPAHLVRTAAPFTDTPVRNPGTSHLRVHAGDGGCAGHGSRSVSLCGTSAALSRRLRERSPGSAMMRTPRFAMTAPRDLIPMAMFALATLVGVGVVVVLGELLRRGILYVLAVVLPPDPDPTKPRDAPRARPADPGES